MLHRPNLSANLCSVLAPRDERLCLTLDGRRSGGGGGSGGGASSSGLRSLYERVAFWKHGTVRHGKRTMLRNSKESLWLLAPFVVWGLVVVVMHSLGYVIMEQVRAGGNWSRCRWAWGWWCWQARALAALYAHLRR